MNSMGRAAQFVGVGGPVLFVGSFTLQGLRPDFNATAEFVGELSLGPLGWIQQATFVATGVLFVVFGWMLVRARFARASLVGPLLFTALGAGFACLAFFATDPSLLFEQATPQGVVHGVLSAVVFSLFALTCFVFYREFRVTGHVPLAFETLAVGVVILAGIVVLTVSQQPDSPLFEVKGLVQRCVIVLFMAWMGAFAVVRFRPGWAELPAPSTLRELPEEPEPERFIYVPRPASSFAPRPVEPPKSDEEPGEAS